MICQICKEREATIQLTKVINGVKTELHLCEQCASKEALNLYQMDFTNFINEFLNLESKVAGDTKPETHSEIKCKNCGMEFEEFRKTGKLGCDECYNAFQPMLEPLIKRIHGRTVHTGKIAQNGNPELKRKRELTEMQKQLEEAIRTENYELAAEYRDIIRLLKEKHIEADSQPPEETTE
jgi:protein arginine kinase activator